MGMHRKALDAAITAAGPKLTRLDDPLVELSRALADQVDAAGTDGPGTRLAATYLTTLRTLHTRMGAQEERTVAGKLAQLRSLSAGNGGA